MPLAKRLFSKAICQSGSGLIPTIDRPGHVATYTILAAAEKAAAELLELLGALPIAEPRGMPGQKIMATQ